MSQFKLRYANLAMPPLLPFQMPVKMDEEKYNLSKLPKYNSNTQKLDYQIFTNLFL